ncbi:MAG: hypothetical protein AAF376_17105 [Pseudomonadota bacterium]
MCHGHIDPKTLMREAEERYRIAQPVSTSNRTSDQPTEIPPELIGGLKGVFARLRARLPHRSRVAQVAAEQAIAVLG